MLPKRSTSKRPTLNIVVVCVTLTKKYRLVFPAVLSSRDVRSVLTHNLLFQLLKCTIKKKINMLGYTI